ncbi:MAG: 30S ribosomal protein S12 methylthiotransferase RimO [bacterium]
MPSIGMISLGCTKNLVDTEVMLGLLTRQGYSITPNAEEADIIVVNTCSFIEEAKRESIETILEMCHLKERGRCRNLIVTGCLAQEYGIELFREIPEIDAILGSGEFMRIVPVIEALIALSPCEHLHFIAPPSFLYDHTCPRLRSTRGHLAYVKISEGCDHCCSYCLIPRLRGRYRQRNAKSVVTEVEALVDEGVKEVCLIGQDTTAFKGLPTLLERLASINEAPWIRLLYAYPFSLSSDLIRVMAEYPSILPYLDIPLQHSHPRVLSAMNRPTDIGRVEEFIDHARSAITDMVIRTTLMVGFPGETDEEFDHMLRFVRRIRFDRLGVFSYSREKGTPAARLPNQVPRRIKRARYHEIMRVQAGIAEEKNRALIGRAFTAICDYPHPDRHGVMVGRTKGQAPDIDGVTFIQGEGLSAGEICKITITRADVYDLEGIREASPECPSP